MKRGHTISTAKAYIDGRYINRTERTMTEYHMGIAFCKLDLALTITDIRRGEGRVSDVMSGWFVGKAVRMNDGLWRITIDDAPSNKGIAAAFKSVRVF